MDVGRPLVVHGGDVAGNQKSQNRERADCKSLHRALCLLHMRTAKTTPRNLTTYLHYCIFAFPSTSGYIVAPEILRSRVP